MRFDLVPGPEDDDLAHREIPEPLERNVLAALVAVAASDGGQQCGLATERLPFPLGVRVVAHGGRQRRRARQSEPVVIPSGARNRHPPGRGAPRPGRRRFLAFARNDQLPRDWTPRATADNIPVRPFAGAPPMTKSRVLVALVAALGAAPAVAQEKRADTLLTV